MFELHWPWLLVLIPLPLLVYRLKPVLANNGIALWLPTFGVLQREAGKPAIAVTSRAVLLVLIAVWLMSLLAAARPQWIGDAIALPTTGRDLLLAVDISGSMETPDMIVNKRQTSRIAVVKTVVKDFVARRTGDRVGLVLFGTHAYQQVPLTFDRTTVQQLMEETQLGFAGKYTAIGEAIGLSTKRLQQQKENERVLILMTDGANTTGDITPEEGTRLAVDQHVKIYTIGIGASEMIVQDFFMSRRVNPSSDLDEKLLQDIADRTGGRYFRARNPEELQQIYAMIDQLEPSEKDPKTYRPIAELFYWPLSLAFLLMVALLLRRGLPGGNT